MERDEFGRTRRTGSTTRMLEEAVRLAREERRAVYVVAGALGMVPHIERALDGLLAPEERRHRLGIKVESWASFGVPNTETGRVPGAHPNCVVLMDHHAAETRFRWVLLQWLRFAEPNGPAVIEPDHTGNRERIAALEKACEQRAAERDEAQRKAKMRGLTIDLFYEALGATKGESNIPEEITALRTRAERAEADLVTTMRVARAFFDSMSAALRRHREPELDMRLVDELNEILIRRGALAQPEQPDDSSQTSSSSGGVCLAPAPARQGLTFAQLRVANRTRNEALFPADDWSLNDWMTAAAGELGEAANVLKKVRRGDYSLNGDSYGTPSAREMLANELGDVVAYLDLLADHAGVDLGTATAEKWDIISRRLGYPRLISDFAQPEPSAPCETCGGSGLVAIGEPELLDPEVPWSLQQPCEPCPACGGGA